MTSISTTERALSFSKEFVQTVLELCESYEQLNYPGYEKLFQKWRETELASKDLRDLQASLLRLELFRHSLKTNEDYMFRTAATFVRALGGDLSDKEKVDKYYHTLIKDVVLGRKHFSFTLE
jgi:hypothetical protein